MHQHFKENRLRGNPAYPFVLYEMPQEDNALCAAMHWQDDVEVLCITRGSVELTLDGSQQILHADDMICINPGQLHAFRAHSADAQCAIFIFPIQHLLFVVDDHDQQHYLRQLADGHLGFPLRLHTDCHPYQLIKQMIDLQKRRPVAYEMLTKALLLQMIAHLAQQDAFVPLQSARHNDVCKQILLYIQQHYSEKITVQDIAKAVAISPTYFSAFFARHFFCRFSDYLRNFWIEQACAMLTGTNTSVTEIALSVGFNSASHLVEQFRKTKNVTPRTYRNARR